MYNEKDVFYLNQTITESFGHTTGAFDYIIKSFSYITEACGYNSITIKISFISEKNK